MSHTSLLSIHNKFQSFDGIRFKILPPSKYGHAYTHGLANYRGKPLAIGCYPERRTCLNGSVWDPLCSLRTGIDCKVKTELMDMESKTWLNGPDYPFAGIE